MCIIERRAARLDSSRKTIKHNFHTVARLGAQDFLSLSSGLEFHLVASKRAFYFGSNPLDIKPQTTRSLSASKRSGRVVFCGTEEPHPATVELMIEPEGKELSSFKSVMLWKTFRLTTTANKRGMAPYGEIYL